MKILLDTHSLLWFLSGDAGLTERARRLIENTDHDILVSIACLWEIAIKNGHNPALVAAGGHQDFIAVPDVVKPVDTTAAGDSFNAGYMSARLNGGNPADAAAAGHKLAAEVIQHRGAIMPRNAAAFH